MGGGARLALGSDLATAAGEPMDLPFRVLFKAARPPGFSPTCRGRGCWRRRRGLRLYPPGGASIYINSRAVFGRRNHKGKDNWINKVCEGWVIVGLVNWGAVEIAGRRGLALSRAPQLLFLGLGRGGW